MIQLWFKFICSRFIVFNAWIQCVIVITINIWNCGYYCTVNFTDQMKYNNHTLLKDFVDDRIHVLFFIMVTRTEINCNTNVQMCLKHMKSYQPISKILLQKIISTRFEKICSKISLCIFKILKKPQKVFLKFLFFFFFVSIKDHVMNDNKFFDSERRT